MSNTCNRLLENYSEADVVITDSVHVKIGLVLWNGKDWIRMRVFKKWSSDKIFHPSKSGIMFDMETFKEKILPVLNQYAND